MSVHARCTLACPAWAWREFSAVSSHTSSPRRGLRARQQANSLGPGVLPQLPCYVVCLPVGLLRSPLLSVFLFFPWFPCLPNPACISSAACLSSQIGLNLQAWILAILLRFHVALVLPELLCGPAVCAFPSLSLPSHCLSQSHWGEG